jgi:glycosyltransferase involved in cell wall biosynthesis
MSDHGEIKSDHRQFDLAAASRLMADCGLFDSSYYLSAAGPMAFGSPIEHYLLGGWREGLEPSAEFEGGWLYPYFASAGFTDPPALTYATLQRAGAPVYATRKSAEKVAKLVRDSGLFDAKDYAAQVGNIGGLDPALHYVIVGERLGYAPSPGFDPIYYMERYPEVAQSPECLLAHYCRRGKRKGCRSFSTASSLTFDRSRLDPERKTILIVSHQASRTGAPILAYNIAKRLAQKYNIVTLILLPGELIADFDIYSAAVVGPAAINGEWLYPDGIDPIEAKYIVKHLLANYPISFAIVNSIDSRAMLQPLTLSFVPTVTLVHEFPDDLTRDGRPAGAMGRALDWTTQIVFSSKCAADAARVDYPDLEGRRTHILPQGPSELPPRGNPVSRQQQASTLYNAMRPPGAEQHIVVLGCGTIFARKGVDLFFACAARVAALQTEKTVRFIWIGQRLPKSMQSNYFDRLARQIRRAGVADRAIILDEVTDLEPAYASADMLFVSSRIDALPNIAIDCALRGLPIVCFDDTGGVPELLKSDDATKIGVVPYLDIDAAAAVIVRLSNDAALREQTGRITQQLGQRIFDMDRYVAHLEELGHDAARIMRQRIEDFETIRDDPSFDMWHFLDYASPTFSRDDAIRLCLSRAPGGSKQPKANLYYRRPCPGFHPHIYIHENLDRYDAAVVNPLAHYIRAGKPNGRWRHEVIMPGRSSSSHVNGLRTAVHAHFFYPGLFADFLKKIAVNKSKCDLFLTTNNNANARLLGRAAAHYSRGEVILKVVPNRGRDVGAMLTALSDELMSYDIIGHFHSKRSIHVPDLNTGERWREFLWQNLLGDCFPMMDTILDYFAEFEIVGLVFADDPHLSDWDLNRDIAEDLARKCGMRSPLPPSLDFPIGTMFWARRRALEPLFALGLKWNDYPAEPIPIDGTILHAIERLLPFVARHAGYRYATTHIPGMTW